MISGGSIFGYCPGFEVGKTPETENWVGSLSNFWIRPVISVISLLYTIYLLRKILLWYRILVFFIEILYECSTEHA